MVIFFNSVIIYASTQLHVKEQTAIMLCISAYDYLCIELLYIITLLQAAL